MTRDDIDIMWQRALQDSVRDGEMFTRYHFAKLVEAHTRGQMFKPDWDNYRQGLIDGAVSEREACAKLVEVSDDLQDWEIICGSDGRVLLNEMAEAIRARGNT